MSKERKVVGLVHRSDQTGDSERMSTVTTVGGAEQDSTRDAANAAHRSALAKADIAQRNVNLKDESQRRQTLISVPDQVAGDTMFFTNHRWPEANKYFPEDVDAPMRFVSRFYPYALEGELYIDEPKSLKEVDRCEKKRKIMKKMKLRYVVVNRQYIDPDGLAVEACKLSEALEQLE